MLPPVTLQFTGSVVLSPADVRATASSWVAPSVGSVTDLGAICRRIVAGGSVSVLGFSQPLAASARTSHASFSMASRRDSLCLNVIARSPQLTFRDSTVAHPQQFIKQRGRHVRPEGSIRWRPGEHGEERSPTPRSSASPSFDGFALSSDYWGMAWADVARAPRSVPATSVNIRALGMLRKLGECSAVFFNRQPEVA